MLLEVMEKPFELDRRKLDGRKKHRRKVKIRTKCSLKSKCILSKKLKKCKKRSSNINPAEMEARGLHHKLLLKSRLCEKRNAEIQLLKKKIAILTSNQGPKELSLKLANVAFENSEMRADLDDSQRSESELLAKVKVLEGRIRHLKKVEDARISEMRQKEEESDRQIERLEKQLLDLGAENMIVQEKLMTIKTENEKYEMKFQEQAKIEMQNSEVRKEYEKRAHHLKSIINELKLSLIQANERADSNGKLESILKQKNQELENKLQIITEESEVKISRLQEDLGQDVIRLEAENQQMFAQFAQWVKDKLALNEQLVRLRTNYEVLKQNAERDRNEASKNIEKHRRKSRNTNQHFRNQLSEFQTQCTSLRQDLEECKEENRQLQDSLEAERMCSQKSKAVMELENREQMEESLSKIEMLMEQLYECRSIILEKENLHIDNIKKLEEQHLELKTSTSLLQSQLDLRENELENVRSAHVKAQEDFEEKIQACLKAVQKAKKCIQMLEFEKEQITTVNEALTGENQRLRLGNRI